MKLIYVLFIPIIAITLFFLSGFSVRANIDFDTHPLMLFEGAVEPVLEDSAS